MIKNFLMKQMFKKQMKGVPQDQQDKMMGMIEKNPELFQKIAMEIQEEMKKGKDQMAATMMVTQKHQDELRKLMG